MSYRDEREGLKARIDVLERELRDKERALEQAQRTLEDERILARAQQRASESPPTPEVVDAPRDEEERKRAELLAQDERRQRERLANLQSERGRRASTRGWWVAILVAIGVGASVVVMHRLNAQPEVVQLEDGREELSERQVLAPEGFEGTVAAVTGAAPVVPGAYCTVRYLLLPDRLTVECSGEMLFDSIGEIECQVFDSRAQRCVGWNGDRTVSVAFDEMRATLSNPEWTLQIRPRQ